MRRFSLLLLSVLLILTLCIPAMGTNRASKLTITAVVGSDKSCQVTINATLHIEDSGESLQFPIPLDATGVMLENTRVRPKKSGQAQLVDLSQAIRNMTGDLSVTISYTLPEVISTNEAGEAELQLPLLSGFKSPISQLDFTVTLPGEIQAKPAFSSGYHQAAIEKELSCATNGNAVIGYSLAELKDHETLTMYLPVEESWFPNAPLKFFESDADDVAMVICGIVALLYWLLFLRFLPPKKTLSPTVPEGITAGQAGSVLTLAPADLSLMVFSWAQLGYLQIQSGNRRVLLHKTMDMGNERSEFEQRCFKKLFGKQSTVDTAGLHYATFCRTIRKLRPDVHSLVQPSSGNVKLFRAICALISLFGGVSFGIAMTQEAVVQGIWIFLTAAAGLFCGYWMQAPVGELFLRKTEKTGIGLAFTAIWLLLGLLAGQFGLAIVLMLLQWLAGFMAFYGGLRTDSGKQEFARIIGLRKYLTTVSQTELRRIFAADPEYFHILIPWAMALGVASGFAKRFGNLRIPECPYITCRSENLHNAKQWTGKMKQTIHNMERRSRKLPMERFLAILAAAKKA